MCNLINSVFVYMSCVRNIYIYILNGWIGDRVRAGITGAFGAPGENDNERRVKGGYI